MRRLRSVNLILAILLVMISLAACSSKAPSLDLSQDDPFATPSDTTAAEPSSDDSTYADSESNETEDLESETHETATETTEEETTTEETTAETFPAEIDGLTFMYTPYADSSTCSINTVIGATDSLVIPETIDGYTVTSLTKGSLSFAKSISSITLPPTIRSIDESVFQLCSYLSEVHISSTDAWLSIKFKSQSSSPMYHARNIFIDGEAITEITVPEGITHINDHAFYNFRDLQTIHLPSGIEEIGTGAFAGSGIREVRIPALEDWFNIKFNNTTSNPLSSARTLYANDKRVRDIVVPDSVTKINPFCFYGFDDVKTVEIHSGVKSIGASAFLECGSLNAVIIRDVAAWCGVEFENETANPLTVAQNLYFNDLTNIYPLSAVEIPATVKRISPYSFSGCTNVVAISFGEGSQLESIGTGAFKGCTNLSTIYIPETVNAIESLAFSMCPNIGYFTINGANYLGSFNNPQHALISLESDNGQPPSITSFTIPETTKIIYQAAFGYCSSLQSIVIPDSVKYIGNSAFYNCSALNSITLGNGITEIGSSVFSNCSSLKSLTIPAGVKTIGRSALSGCTSLISLTLPSELTYIDQYAFRDCEKLTTMTLPIGVNYIGSGALQGCDKLTTVIFGNVNGWYAGTTKISASDLGSASVAAYYLTDDYMLRIWTRK